MFSAGSAAVAISLLVVVPAPLSEWRSQKPVVRLPIVSDSGREIRTFSDLVSVDAIVLVRIALARDFSDATYTRTTYIGEALRVWKGQLQSGRDVAIHRPIGRRELSNRILEFYEPEFPPFDIGHAYLLFLNWDDATKGYWVLDRVIGALRLASDERLEPLSNKHPLSRELKGKTLPELEAMLGLRSR